MICAMLIDGSPDNRLLPVPLRTAITNMADYHDRDDNEYEYEYEPFESESEINVSGQQKSFTVLKETDIIQRQEDDITNVSTVLSISKVDAGILLRHYHWSVSNVHEAWFDDEHKVRKIVGLVKGPVNQFPNAREVRCGICYEEYPLGQISSAICGHPFCRTCWEAYINVSIDGGPGALTLRCPDPFCEAAVDQGMVNQLATDQDKTKYARYVLRSYVEESRKIKWCPAPGCEYAVEFVLGSDSYDVECLCSHGFCWNCSDEAHRPVDCDTVSKWRLKNSDDSKTIYWILENAKPCPKCKRSIERNEGCQHMICPHPCNYQFCWMCLGEWSEHLMRDETQKYMCNRYEAAKGSGKIIEEENKERYTHYFERWATNHMYRRKALVVLQKLKEVQRSQPDTQLNFIVKAWIQIVECRRVLKWTYAYGYFLLDLDETKKTFFEYQQGQAESCLESLYSCAEKNIAFLETYQEDCFIPNLIDFDENLDVLTSVTKDHFEKLVQGLENGMLEVEPRGGTHDQDHPRKESGEDLGRLKLEVKC